MSFLRNKWVRMSLIALTAFATVAVGLAGYGVTEARDVRVITHTVASSRLPVEFDGARVVYLTDIHAGPYLGKAQMRRLVLQVNALNPDIILLGGDYTGGRANGAKIFYPAAADFEATLGKYAVLGNHDVWEGEDIARTGLAKAGFKVLDNENAALEWGGQHIYIAGVEDLDTGTPDVAAASQGIEGFSILLAHNPDTFAQQLPRTSHTWDLALAGHTHGGQMTLFGRAVVLPSAYGERYRTGIRTEDGTPILVSNGIGTVTAPVRYGAPPEIHVFTLQRQPLQAASSVTKS